MPPNQTITIKYSELFFFFKLFFLLSNYFQMKRIRNMSMQHNRFVSGDFCRPHYNCTGCVLNVEELIPTSYTHKLLKEPVISGCVNRSKFLISKLIFESCFRHHAGASRLVDWERIKWSAAKTTLEKQLWEKSKLYLYVTENYDSIYTQTFHASCIWSLFWEDFNQRM